MIMRTEQCPEDPVTYLEDNFHQLMEGSNQQELKGAIFAVEYIAQDYPVAQGYPDSVEIAELYRSTGGLVISKSIPANRERPADQTWRAQALLALAAHKVNTRAGYTEEDMRQDLRMPFEVSSPINYGYIRKGIYERYHQQLLDNDARTVNQELALTLTNKVAAEHKLNLKNIFKAAPNFFRRILTDFS